MPEIRTEYACPLCPADNPGQIVASSGSLECSINRSGHRWNDTKSFMDLKPVMGFKATPQTFPAQSGHVKYDVMISLGTKAKLETKYGGKTNSTVSGVLDMMAEGNILIIPESDVERIRRLINKRPESSAELFGIMFALDQQALDAKNAQESAEKELAAYEKSVPGKMVIDISSILDQVKEKAQSAELPLRTWIETNLKNAIENNWF